MTFRFIVNVLVLLAMGPLIGLAATPPSPSALKKPPPVSRTPPPGAKSPPPVSRTPPPGAKSPSRTPPPVVNSPPPVSRTPPPVAKPPPQISGTPPPVAKPPLPVARTPPPVPKTQPPPGQLTPPPISKARPPVLRTPPPLSKPPPVKLPSQSPPPPVVREKNGIRLVGGSGSRGRLEVSSTTAWFSLPGGQAGWNAVCDVYFTDENAQEMCTLLGYTYGRKYYDLSVAFRPYSSSLPDKAVGEIYCVPPFDRRRLMLQRSSGAGDGDVDLGGDVEGVDADDVATHSRHLLVGPQERHYIDSPADAPQKCYFYTGGPCAQTGPLAGIECSNTVMMPAPPPPPSPPAPPPGPSSYIRKIDPVEPNVWDASPGMYGPFARFELLVVVAGKNVWAPLCSLGDRDSDGLVGSDVCNQVYDWPEYGDGGIEYVRAEPSDIPYAIPQTATSAGDFNAAAYNAWVMITGHVGDGKRVQDKYTYTVSATPCEMGMLAVYCMASK